MELLQQTRIVASNRLILTALATLLLGMAFGLIGGFQYLFPGLYKIYLSFANVRPWHVSSVVFWIFAAASGGTLSYLSEVTGWILVNPVPAILISVPSINLYTHGTPITVAHVMGASIGINSMTLMAMITDVMSHTCRSLRPYRNQMTVGLMTANISLIAIAAALTMAGIKGSQWQMGDRAVPFSVIMHDSILYLYLYVIAGVVLFAGIWLRIYPLLKTALICRTRHIFKVRQRIQTLVE